MTYVYIFGVRCAEISRLFAENNSALCTTELCAQLVMVGNVSVGQRVSISWPMTCVQNTCWL